MGLFSWLFGLFGGRSGPTSDRVTDGSQTTRPERTKSTDSAGKPTRRPPKIRSRVRLVPSAQHETLRRRQQSKQPCLEVAGASPYRFARFGSRTGQYLDLSDDGDEALLGQCGLPVFHTPEQLAEWLGLPLNKVAWLVHRFSAGNAISPEKAHYHYTWRQKRSGGVRLIESPKQTLKQVQVKILREILDRVATHPAAHGFVPGRSIVTNAAPHVGQGIVVKFDLTNFYTTVG
ncbi:MAG TPA: RNA-directed DNA polymerase, partial [Schlesneria sp.]